MVINKRIFLIIPIVLVMSLGIIGCGKKASDKAAEKAIETATNGQADVDVNNNTVHVNTNGGSWEAGDNVSLPSNFPSDIYVVDGKITAAITSTETNGYTISIEATQSVSDLKALYDQKLKADGWEITLSMATSDGAAIGGQKNNRVISVGINPGDEGKTIVVIGTYTTES